jgi:microcystin-dependent protein
MSQPFLGDIRMFAGNFAPIGYAFCDGRLLPISQFSALFALIGTTYGGDGQNTFALPDLRGRVPLHMGTGGGGTYVQGQMAGEENVTLITSQLPQHTHIASADSNNGANTSPAGGVWASSTNNPYAAYTASDLPMAGGAIGVAGGSQPHDNMVPFLAINFIIALEGVFPSRN